MKNFLVYGLIASLVFSSVNCTTSFDAQGNPRQTVSPGAAVAGAAAVGVVAFALAKSGSHRGRNVSHRNNKYHKGSFNKFHKGSFNGSSRGKGFNGSRSNGIRSNGGRSNGNFRRN